jgi:hypothetical protein
MKTKKHKIKISSERDSSSFVLDLRSTPTEKKEIHRTGEKKFSSKNKEISFDYQENKYFKNKRKVSIFYFTSFFNGFFSFFRKNFRLRKKSDGKPGKIKKGFKKTLIHSNKIEQLIKKKESRSIWFFILILFLLIVPFKIFSYYRLATEKNIQNNLWGLSSSALQNFMVASEKISQLDLGMAQRSFFEAGENFLLLDKELNKIDEFIVFLASFSGDEKIRLASESKKIAQIGIHLASAGDNFSLAMDSLIMAFSEGEPNVSDKFSDFEKYLDQAESDFKNVNKYLNKIKERSIPSDYLEQFIVIRDLSNSLEKNLFNIKKSLPGIKDFLAIDSDKRYLVVFQNNSEIRASGGFIGSYALVDLKKGKIKNIEIPPGGSYDTEGGMKVLVESPQPLHLVKPIWYFWDANWWPDWKMSAQNLMWFYEKSGGPSVDGVISLTPDILADVLDLLGPIDMMDKYGVVIDSENFWEIIQEIVEVVGKPELYQDKDLKTDILERVSTSTQLIALEIKEENEENEENEEGEESEESEESELFLRNEPKKIIGDLMVEILEKFSSNFNQEMLLGSLKIMERNLIKKNILLYFSNNKIQDEVENRSWAGRIKESPLDYLMVVNSSVAGGKTDYFIDNNFSLEVEINKQGEIFNKLTIRRNHNGVRDDLFSGVRNVNWMRVYVPLGSSLISADGFSDLDSSYFKKTDVVTEKNSILEKTENKAEIDFPSGTKIYQESGKTVFANWNITDPGQEAVIEIVYKLPYNFYSLIESQKSGIWFNIFPKDPIQNYSLLWQKQPGSSNSALNVDFSSSLTLDPVWTYPDNINGDLRKVKFIGELDRDRYFVIMLK